MLLLFLLCKHFINYMLPQLYLSCLNNHLYNFYIKIIKAVLLVQPNVEIFLSKYPCGKLALRCSPQTVQYIEKMDLFTPSPQKAVLVCLDHPMCNMNIQCTQVTRLHALSIANHVTFHLC